MTGLQPLKNGRNPANYQVSRLQKDMSTAFYSQHDCFVTAANEVMEDKEKLQDKTRMQYLHWDWGMKSGFNQQRIGVYPNGKFCIELGGKVKVYIIFMGNRLKRLPPHCLMHFLTESSRLIYVLLICYVIFFIDRYISLIA